MIYDFTLVVLKKISWKFQRWKFFKKNLYLHNYNNSRHVIYPKILVVALQREEQKNSCKIGEEGIAIFGTNISETEAL